MATVEQRPAHVQDEHLAPSGGIVLKDIPWALYEALRDLEENWHIKMTYDDGVLELMSPSPKHESLKTRIGRLIEALTEELRIPIEGFGSTTWKRPDNRGGLEADTCYYIVNEPLVRGKEEIDQQLDPPPDLAVEIEVSRSAVAKVPIYAGLHVAEIWRCDGKSLRTFHLTPGGEYVEQELSLNLPFLRVADLVPFLARRRGADSNAWIGEFRAWVRERFGTGISGR
ncbi:MAG TPA: Uma2 family endonuclease [Pirellulales bacterium]|nr:Uma2 family endonuclease [Pirellulales bacterium]